MLCKQRAVFFCLNQAFVTPTLASPRCPPPSQVLQMVNLLAGMSKPTYGSCFEFVERLPGESW